MTNLFTMRLAAPIVSLSGPRIDTVGDSLPHSDTFDDNGHHRRGSWY
jgi:hypothetical protein